MSIEKIKSKLEEMEVKLKEIRDTRSKIFQEVVDCMFKEFPNLAGIYWNQYTPYFNDGDACEFSASDAMYVMMNESNEMPELGDFCRYGDDKGHAYVSIDSWDVDGVKEHLLGYNNESRDVVLSAWEDDELLKSLYGDHVEVLITRDGKTQTAEYCHD